MLNQKDYTIDFLRALKEWNDKVRNSYYSVDTIVKNCFKHNNKMNEYADEINKIIIDNNWSYPVNEKGGLKINDEGIAYLNSITTDEYILDRYFDYLKQHTDCNYIGHYLIESNPRLIIDRHKESYLEALIRESELIDTSYCEGDAIKLSSKGIIELNKFEKYSDYIKSLEETKPPIPFIYNQINVGRDMVGNSVNQNSDFRDTNPTLYTNHNIKIQEKKTRQIESSFMKLWKLISENKLIATILAALILAAIYYFIFGIKPGK